MSVIDPADVTPLVATELETADLQGVIDREEAELASVIGPLTGERTEVFLLRTRHYRDTLTLRRTTDAVTVVDNGVAVDSDDVRILADGRTLFRYGADGAYAFGVWTGPVEVTYEPNDLLRVQRVLIELVGIGLGAASASVAGDIVSETTGTYSYTLGRTAAASMTSEQRRRALVASLLPRPKATSIRLRSATRARYGLLGDVRPPGFIS